MQQILDQLNSRRGWDYVIRSFDGWSLAIFGGTAREYATPLVEFKGVTYLSCPMEFSHPHFRLADATESAAVREHVPVEVDEFVVVIEAETMASLGTHVFTLVAESAVLLE